MPVSIFSHQAPGLILKIKYPNNFDGTALCFSTLVPDLILFIDPFLPFSFRYLTHSLLGLFIYTIPLTLILTILFCSYIGPFLANLGKKDSWIYKPLKYFGIDEWDSLKKKKYNRRYFIVASYSSFIGGLTHLLLDLFAHEYIHIISNNNAISRLFIIFYYRFWYFLYWIYSNRCQFTCISTYMVY